MSAPVVRCAGEPVSWLVLERYRLGELPEARRRTVEAHLAACPACAACLAEIDGPLPLPPLPARVVPPPSWWSRLRAVLGRPFGESHVHALPARRSPARIWAPAGAAGLAALAVVALLARPKPGNDTTLADATLRGTKGGGIAISLVRARDGRIDHDARTFTARDRWKVLVTCPSERVLFWDVVVTQGATPSFPLSPAAPIACGNHVPLPGAFQVDGRAPATICALLAADPVDRSQLSTLAAPALAGAACVTLQPASSDP